jgi:medium-chain acyl-[acyl-carrier-protein] hydrolase
VLENPELMRAMQATLRADFKLAETYVCTTTSPLSCPVTAFAGSEDTCVTQKELEAWKVQTIGSCKFWTLPGDHFFLHTSEALLLQALVQDIRGVLSRRGNCS